MILSGRRAWVAVAALVGFFVLTGPAAAAPFTPGNVVVYRVGDGSSALGSAATAVFLDEYLPNGTLVQSIALPTTVSGSNRRVVASGTAGSDGLLNRSVDGRYLLATGYEAAIGTASITSTLSASNARVVARIYADGTINSSTALADAASGTNFRSAASLDGSAFWVTGGTGTAVRYAALGATTSTQLFTTPSNFRFVNIAGGQLYVSTGTGTRLMATVGSGTPTTATQTVTNLSGLPTTTSVYNQHFFADLNPGVAGVDTLYIADENAGVGIIKYSYSLSTTSWVSNGSIGEAATPA